MQVMKEYVWEKGNEGHSNIPAPNDFFFPVKIMVAV